MAVRGRAWCPAAGSRRRASWPSCCFWGGVPQHLAGLPAAQGVQVAVDHFRIRGGRRQGPLEAGQRFRPPLLHGQDGALQRVALGRVHFLQVLGALQGPAGGAPQEPGHLLVGQAQGHPGGDQGGVARRGGLQVVHGVGDLAQAAQVALLHGLAPLGHAPGQQAVRQIPA